jgi:outer membrane protein
MKKVIFTVAVIFAFGFANAQDKKVSTGEGFANGDVFVSGTVGFNSQKTGDVKSSGFEISPKAGMFVTDKIAIGAKLGYAANKAENGFGDTADNTTLSVGVFARQYCHASSTFSVFGNLGFDYMSMDNKLADSKTTGFEIALSPGVSYFLNSNFAMEASFGKLGYSSFKPDADGADSTNTFELGLDLSSITFGLVYKF